MASEDTSLRYYEAMLALRRQPAALPPGAMSWRLVSPFIGEEVANISLQRWRAVSFAAYAKASRRLLAARHVELTPFE